MGWIVSRGKGYTVRRKYVCKARWRCPGSWSNLCILYLALLYCSISFCFLTILQLLQIQRIPNSLLPLPLSKGKGWKREGESPFPFLCFWFLLSHYKKNVLFSFPWKRNIRASCFQTAAAWCFLPHRLGKCSQKGNTCIIFLKLCNLYIWKKNNKIYVKISQKNSSQIYVYDIFTISSHFTKMLVLKTL